MKPLVEIYLKAVRYPIHLHFVNDTQTRLVPIRSY